MNTKKILLLLLGCTLFGVGLVVVLFLLSEEQLQQNNAFQRRYMPHPIIEVGSYELGYSNYYIAGLDTTNIYLGNYSDVFTLTTVAVSLQESKSLPLVFDHEDLAFQRIQLRVLPPNIYMGDGTVPILYKGKINKGELNMWIKDEAYFTDFVILDSAKVGFITVSSTTQTRALGKLIDFGFEVGVALETDFFREQQKSLFETEGMLLWNTYLEQFVYPYHYVNQYEVGSESLEHLHTGKTIDTISEAQLDVTHYTTKEQFKRGGKSVLVHRLSATSGAYLYVNSERLGKYEAVEDLYSASIIDVYQLKNSSYSFSFYIYHQPYEKLHQFAIYKDLLVALVGDTLWLYRLKSDYFEIK